MKALHLLVILSLSILVHAAEQEIHIVRGGKVITERPRSALATNVIELLGSASVHSTSYAVTNNTWQELLRSDSFVHLRFAAPRKIAVMMTPMLGERYPEPTLVNEILVPLPEREFPHHLYFKSGTNIFSVTKYTPLPLKHLISDPALQLKDLSAYADLAKLPEDK